MINFNVKTAILLVLLVQVEVQINVLIAHQEKC